MSDLTGSPQRNNVVEQFAPKRKIADPEFFAEAADNYRSILQENVALKEQINQSVLGREKDALKIAHLENEVMNLRSERDEHMRRHMSKQITIDRMLDMLNRERSESE